MSTERPPDQDPFARGKDLWWIIRAHREARDPYPGLLPRVDVTEENVVIAQEPWVKGHVEEKERARLRSHLGPQLLRDALDEVDDRIGLTRRRVFREGEDLSVQLSDDEPFGSRYLLRERRPRA